MNQGVGVAGLEDIEGLFFEEDLLVGGEVCGDLGVFLVGDAENFLRKGFGDEVSACGLLQAVRVESGEFGVVEDVVAAVGDEEHFLFAGCVG